MSINPQKEPVKKNENGRPWVCFFISSGRLVSPKSKTRNIFPAETGLPHHLFFALSTQHSALSTQHFFSFIRVICAIRGEVLFLAFSTFFPPLQIVQNVFFVPGGVKNAVLFSSPLYKSYILYNFLNPVTTTHRGINSQLSFLDGGYLSRVK
jgi:hypothetical protein